MLNTPNPKRISSLVPRDTAEARYGTIEAAREVGISLRRFYHWLYHADLIRPQLEQRGVRTFRRYTPGDLEKFRRLKELVDNGFTLQAAAEIVRESWPQPEGASTARSEGSTPDGAT